MFYYNRRQILNFEGGNYLYLDSDYLFVSFLFKSIINIGSINSQLVLNNEGENKSFIFGSNSINGYYINNKEKLIYTSPDSNVNYIDYISNDFVFNYNKFIDENGDKVFTEKESFSAIPDSQEDKKNYLDFYDDYNWFNIYDDYSTIKENNKEFLNHIYNNPDPDSDIPPLNQGNNTSRLRVAKTVVRDVRKIKDLNITSTIVANNY